MNNIVRLIIDIDCGNTSFNPHDEVHIQNEIEMLLASGGMALKRLKIIK